jgi:hypothetical protein
LVIEVDCIAGYAADLDVDAAAGRTPLKCAVHVQRLNCQDYHGG